MASICFYFQVHQPYRVRRFRVFEIGSKHDGYFSDLAEDEQNNKKILKKVTEKCYLPTNKVMLKLLEKHPEFKISYSFSGVVLEQFEEYAPEVIESFKKLIDTGRAEILAETYYHSLSYLYSKDEFVRQVEKHAAIVKRLFGVEPKVFRNTELIYNNDLAQFIEDMGYKGIIAEGADHILDWRSPNFIYTPKGTTKIKALLKNYKLSDDIAFRFSNKGWNEYPLKVDKYVKWLNAVNGNGELINLFMDYETFGEHQWEDTGIFKFLAKLPEKFLEHPDNNFVTPSEAVDKYESFGEIDIEEFISWADLERDLSAWRANSMQFDAFDKIYGMEEEIMATADEDLLDDWRKLQTSDHFYYMCVKWFNDGDVHKYFSPYESPYEAFISYMNALKDLRMRLDGVIKKRTLKTLAPSKKVLVAKI